MIFVKKLKLIYTIRIVEVNTNLPYSTARLLAKKAITMRLDLGF